MNVKTNSGETLGERLRRLRAEAGLSQREVSSPGVSYAYISRIEAGTREPSVKALRKLARKLDVPVEYLETGTFRTTTDDLLLELRDAVGFDRLSISVGERVEVTWPNPDGDDRTMEVEGSLTEALMEAVTVEREVAKLASEEEAIRERRAEVLGRLGVRAKETATA